MPLRVKIAVWVTTSSGVPGAHPAADAAVLALRVLADADEVDLVGRPVAQRPGMPGSRRIGRRLMYRSNAWRIGSSMFHSDTWSGTPGKADGAQVDRVAVAHPVERVVVHHPAVLRVVLARPRVVDGLDGERAGHLGRGARSRRVPPGSTSRPTPSPSMTASRYVSIWCVVPPHAALLAADTPRLVSAHMVSRTAPTPSDGPTLAGS